MDKGQEFLRFFPSTGLREFVLSYGVLHLVFPQDVSIPAKVYTPKPAETIEFFLRDPEYVAYPEANQKVKRPSAILTGQQTGIINRYVGREFLFFNIHFQPGALFRLVGIPRYELTNTFIDAESVFSIEIKGLTEQLKNVGSYAELIQRAESFVGRLIRRSKKEAHGIDRAAQLLIQNNNPISMDWLASQSCLSARQFERKFKERMGVTASHLARIARFDKAFAMKNAQPQLDWLSVALQCGYYDYPHLVRDYKAFTGITPACFLDVDLQAPERLLGFKEKIQLATRRKMSYSYYQRPAGILQLCLTTPFVSEVERSARLFHEKKIPLPFFGRPSSNGCLRARPESIGYGRFDLFVHPEAKSGDYHYSATELRCD